MVSICNVSCIGIRIGLEVAYRLGPDLNREVDQKKVLHVLVERSSLEVRMMSIMFAHLVSCQVHEEKALSRSTVEMFYKRAWCSDPFPLVHFKTYSSTKKELFVVEYPLLILIYFIRSL